ncbi:interferon-inducible GTPase-domain-containing protein, partial [Morchella snyderi]
MKEIEERTKKEQMERGKLEEEMKVIRDGRIARNKEEREENEKRKKEVEALLKKQEEDRVRMEKEKKDNMEAMEKEMKATQEQREELQRQMKKTLEDEEERKKKEAEREAQQQELYKQRDEEIRIAREEAEKEAEARRKAEDDLRKGIRPEMIPTEDDIQRVKAKLQYTDDHFHFAICGQAGSGKSSLINALRGMKNTGPGSAKTGAVETTQSIGRYPDMDKRPPRAWIVWYDIPGAGTSNISDWQYFNDQGLFIFDLIILAVGDRLSTIDMWIIKNSRRFNVPCFIIRSKSDQHIRNVAKNELEYDSEDEDQDHKAIKEQARRTFTEQTRQNFVSVLAKENLPLQRTYIISASAMYSYINGKPKSIIDEGDLIEDLMQAAYARVEIKVTE